MTDPEREHFVRQMRELERRLRRWRLACLVVLGLLLLPVVLGGLLGVWLVPRLERERAERRAVQEATRFLEERVDDRKARLQALEEAARELQRGEGRRPAPQEPGEGKD